MAYRGALLARNDRTVVPCRLAVSGGIPMEALLGFVGATLVGSAGWWMGNHVGLLTAWTLSAVGSGVGLYAGRRFAREHLP
jgi:hypothetical protein